MNRFLGVCPQGWLARRKPADYGVDLELEIFDAVSKHATGLLFYAQLRATESAKRSRKISLSYEQLQYFEQLPAPTIVVRYAAAENAFYWQWHFTIIKSARDGKGQKSFTYNFSEDERWCGGSASAIEATLAVRKRIASYSASFPVAVRVDAEALTTSQRYIAESGVNDALEASRGVLCSIDASPEMVTLEVIATSKSLRIAIDQIGSVGVPVDHYDRTEVTASMLYGAASILATQGLVYQAQRVARATLEFGQPHSLRAIAVDAAILLMEDVDRAVDLALLNGIHTQHDEHYLKFIASMLQNSERAKGGNAEKRFFDAALIAAAAVSRVTAASVHYSIGNFFRTARPAYAIHHYNKARKLRPLYDATDYFLRELGACLFFAGHYRCATISYSRAMQNGGSETDHLHLGDVYLFSGDLARAEAAFELASNAASLLLSTEARLKLQLCQWLAALAGTRVLPVRANEARVLLEEDASAGPELWERLIKEVDATNELAHFNLAVRRGQEGNFDDAMGGFLLCAVKKSGDLEAWANAVICCQNAKGDAETLFAILATAISLAGRSAYDYLRERLTEQGAADPMLHLLDEAARTFNAMRVDGTNSLTIRVLGEVGDGTIGSQ